MHDSGFLNRQGQVGKIPELPCLCELHLMCPLRIALPTVSLQFPLSLSLSLLPSSHFCLSLHP